MVTYNTTTDIKEKYFNKFVTLISNQFTHGGDKYKLPGFDDREATDVISTIFGGDSQLDWILGTMLKYIFRFKNFKREKDLLKIATYCYILWLKQGNHLKDTNDEDTNKDSSNVKGNCTNSHCVHFPNNPTCSKCFGSGN